MPKTHTANTFNSLDALAVLLPSGTVIDGPTAEFTEALADPSQPMEAPSADAIDDDALLGLASRLQQSVRQWCTRMALGASLDAQARELQTQRERLAGEVERSRAHWRQQKGRRALQELLNTFGPDLPCFDAETSRLLETARQSLDCHDRQMEDSLNSELDALHALTMQLEQIEGDPAVQLYRAEQARQAENTEWQRLFEQAQEGYRLAHQSHELEAVRALAVEITLQTRAGTPIQTQAEQLLAMVETDLEQTRAAETAAAERAARASFGKWLNAVSRRRSADDLVLTFGIGQGVHVALTEQRNGKGHRRVMLVSAVGFELLEPIVRTLVPQPSRAGYFQLQPATGLPAGGHARQFDWQRSARRPDAARTGYCPDAACGESV